MNVKEYMMMNFYGLFSSQYDLVVKGAREQASGDGIDAHWNPNSATVR